MTDLHPASPSAERMSPPYPQQPAGLQYPQASGVPAQAAPAQAAPVQAAQAPGAVPPPGATQPGAYQPPASGYQQATQAVWWTDAPNDPWRNAATRPDWTPPAQPPTPGPPPPPVVAGAVGEPRLGKFLLLSLIVALFTGLVGGAIGYVVADKASSGNGFSLGDGDGSTPELAKRPVKTVAGIVDKVQPSVVMIRIRSGSTEGNGSGFVISDDGHILTNNHVAAAGGNGGLSVVFHDGSTAKATVVGSDPGSDVAVLKVEGKKVNRIAFGDSDKLKVGDPVVAFGSPLGLNETVTTGIVSAIDRPVLTGGEQSSDGGGEAYMAAVQTDAAINPGNSGGPLVDGGGRVIGINSAIATLPNSSGKGGNIGLGFAIPINQAKRIAEQIIGDGKAKTTVIGASLDQNYTSDDGGALLKEVEGGGPADKAGLKNDDVVKKFNGRVIDDAVALIALIRKQPSGSRIAVEYERGGQAGSTTVTLGERDSG